MEDQNSQHEITSQTQYHKRWKTSMMTQDCRAKQINPTIKPNPKGIQDIGNQINASKQICELEEEIAYVQHGQGSLGSFPCYCSKSLLPCSLESSQAMKRLKSND
jgi:hypothetical protein